MTRIMSLGVWATVLLGIALSGSCAPGAHRGAGDGQQPTNGCDLAGVAVQLNGVPAMQSFTVTGNLGSFAVRMDNREDQRGPLQIQVAASPAMAARFAKARRT